MTSLKTVQFSSRQDPQSSLSIYVQHSPTPLNLGVQFQTTKQPSPLLQMITRQLKENIIQGWLLYVIRSFFQVGFRFQYQLINLVWPFGWCLTTCFCVASYSVVQKYYEMPFIYNHSHFQYWFCNQPALFAQTGNVEKLGQQPHRAVEWTKSKQKQNQAISHSN